MAGAFRRSLMPGEFASIAKEIELVKQARQYVPPGKSIPDSLLDKLRAKRK